MPWWAHKRVSIMKKCPRCSIEKELHEFAKNKNQSDGLQRTCKSCVAIQSKKSYDKDSSRYKERIKKQVEKCDDYVEQYKTSHSCKKCGENRNWILDFHHINPKEKKYNMGDLKHSGSFNKIKDEMSKCVLLCKNCHYDFHYLERIFNTSIEEYLK